MANRTTLFRICTLLVCLALAGCIPTENRYAQKVAELERQNAVLQAQVDSLTSQLEAINSSVLLSWDLTAETTGPKTSPVTVRFTAVPAVYQAGQSALLQVSLNGQEKASVPCVWDGAAYTALLTLDPADGYGYCCVLTGSNGREESTVLSTPENPQRPVLTFLESSLNAYCNLIVSDWKATDDSLTIVSGTGLIQLPLLSQNQQSVSCTQVQLVLQRNGKTLDTKDIPLMDGETENSFLAVIDNVSFALPELEAEDQLDLWLDVYLSEGGGLTTSGGSWYPSSGSLDLVVG